MAEGKPSESLPNEKVYMDQRTGQTYDGARGHKYGQLPDDVLEFDKSTWGFRMPWSRREGERPSSTFSKWFDEPEWRKVLQRDATEITGKYPGIQPYLDDNDELLWKGVIGEVGEVELRYDELSRKERVKEVSGNVRIRLLAQPESVTERVDESACVNRLTAIQALDLAVTVVANGS